MDLFDQDEHEAAGIPARKVPEAGMCRCRDAHALTQSTRDCNTGEVRCNRCNGLRRPKMDEEYVPDYGPKIRPTKGGTAGARGVGGVR